MCFRILFLVFLLIFIKNEKDIKISENPQILKSLDEFKQGKYLSFFNTNCKILRHSKDSLERAKAFYMVGFYYYTFTKNHQQALKYLNAAKNIFEHKNSPYLAKCYLKMGEIFFDISDYSTAEIYILKGLGEANKNGLIVQQYRGNIMLGIISKTTHNYPEALTYFMKAHDMATLNIVKNAILAPTETCLINQAELYSDLGHLDRTISIYKKILDSKKITPLIYTKVLDNLAEAYRRKGRLGDAFILLDKAERIRKVNKMLDGHDNNEFIKVKCLADKGDLSIVVNLAKKAIYTHRDMPQLVLDYLGILIKSDTRFASTYGSQYIRISDSIQLAERRNRNKYARIAFETDEIIQEKDNAIRQKKIAIATGSGLLLCSVLFLIIRIQRSRQKELIHIQQQQRSDQAIYDLVHNQQSQIDEARQHEKTRIARELHDGVMNRLSSTRLNLYVLNSQRDDATIDKCVRLIDDLQNVEKELRQVAHELSDDIFSGNKSFNVLLQALIDENRPLTEAQIHVEIDERINWELCEGAIKINAYRILQEALQNIRKYSNARNIFVTLSKIDNELKLVIYDDGIGFNPDKKRKGIGIKNIFTRVNSLNGTIKLLTQPGQGVAYNISLPLSKN